MCQIEGRAAAQSDDAIAAILLVDGMGVENGFFGWICWGSVEDRDRDVQQAGNLLHQARCHQTLVRGDQRPGDAESGEELGKPGDLALAKSAMALCVLMICCAVLVPGLWLIFPAGQAFAESPGQTALLALLGCAGYVAIGTLFAAGLATGAGKNTLLFVILYPLTTPVLMYALVTTRALLDRDPALPDHLMRMFVLDIILFAAACLLFETVLVGAPARPPTRGHRPPRGPATPVHRDMSRETSS